MTGVVLVLLMGVPASAMHPLITDDAGTQGKGRLQLEVNGSYGTDRISDAGTTVKTVESDVVTNLTYGTTDTLDVFVEMPYAWLREKVDGVVAGSENGIADLSIGAKWRFFENEGFCLAFKPFVTLATGDETKGLGAGKTGYGVFLIATREFKPVDMEAYLNIGYVRNENKAGEEKNLWHVSLAAVHEVVEHFKLAANLGMEKNPDGTADKAPAFGLLGIIYEVGEDLDLSLGFKMGLNDAEADRTALAGLTVRFSSLMRAEEGVIAYP